MNLQPKDRSLSPHRRNKPARRPTLESLEHRLALSTAHPIHASSHALGTISGQVTNDATGKGLRHVQVQLIDSAGSVVKRASTNAKGQYSFKVFANGPYIVRVVRPKFLTQVTPTFATTEPVGSFVPGAGSSSWSYSTGNSDPSQGSVGPYAWDTIAPRGMCPSNHPSTSQGRLST